MADESLRKESTTLLSFDDMQEAVRRVGQERYHHQHPFHLLMHDFKVALGITYDPSRRLLNHLDRKD